MPLLDGTGVTVLAVVGFAASVAGVLFARRVRTDAWAGAWLGVGVAVLGLLLLSAVVALGALDDLLGRIHAANAADKALTTLTGPGAILGTDLSEFRDIAQRWLDWYANSSTPFVARPTVVANLYLAIDSLVLLPAYVTLIAMIRWRSAVLVGNDEEPVGRKKRVGRMLRRVALPITLAAVDTTENILVAVSFTDPIGEAIAQEPAPTRVALEDGWLWAIKIAATLKWLLLAAVIITTLPSLIRLLLAWRDARNPKRLWVALFRLRAILLVLAAFAAVAFLPLQTPDVIRRWNPWQAVGTAVAVLMLGLVLGRSSARALAATRDHELPPGRARIALVGGVLVGLGTVGWFSWGSWGPRGLVIPGGLLLVLAGLEWILPVIEARPSPTFARIELGVANLPKILSVAPLAILGLAVMRATLPEAIFHHPDEAWPTLAILLFAGILPSILVVALFVALGRWSVTFSPGTQAWLRVGGLLLLVYLWSRVFMAVWSVSQAVGVLVVAAVFLASLAAGFGFITEYVERHAPPRGLAIFGFARTPVLLFMIVWVVLMGWVERREFHDVRKTLVARGWTTLEPIAAAETGWLPAQSVPSPDRSSGERRPIPMIFVTANGGGIKAATWTALALDCVLRGGTTLQDPRSISLCESVTRPGTDRTEAVFAASGVSGGSVGLVEYVADHRHPEWHATNWAREALGDDFISPLLTWQMFMDIPRWILQFEWPVDRAEVLERSWERAWLPESHSWSEVLSPLARDEEQRLPLSDGFMQTWSSDGWDPLLILNGTTVEDGCRFVTSPLLTAGAFDGRNCTTISRLEDAPDDGQFFAASRDIESFLCPGVDSQGRSIREDIALSTAALLSARFPYATPSARLRFCDAEDESVHVVDGGYRDNSGGASISELWTEVAHWVESYNASAPRSCIVPYLIEIDSGYGPTPDAKNDDADELFVPPNTASSAKDSMTIEGRNTAALLFRQPLTGVDVEASDRLAVIYPHNDADGEPPLGWTIDDTSINALDAQIGANQLALGEVASWFVDSRACA